MGITWCRERLEQAQNSKNPVDRILIRCSNAMKPKTYSRSQDRLADDIVYRGVRKDNLQTAPPRSRVKLRGMTDWQSCVLTVPDDPTDAPIPPPRKKRKRKINGDVNGSQELLSGEEENKENAVQPVEKKLNRFVKQSENRRRCSHGDREDKPRKREQKMRVVKNVSTVSLPNYDELAKPAKKVDADAGEDKSAGDAKAPPPPRRNQSTMSLPGEATKPKLSSLSEATIHRLETYMKRCRSFGSLKPQQLLEKLEEFNKTNRSESESSDSWSGLDDWDMGVIEYCDPEMVNAPPLTPKSRLPPRNKTIFSVGSPQETPRPQSPVSELEEEAMDKGPQVDVGSVLFESESVPTDWFSESQKMDKLEVEKEKTKTPPPSPANGPADPEQAEESQSSLLEILTKYRDEELSDMGSMRRESSSTSTEEDGARKPSANARKLMRNRSQSLIEPNPHLLGVERITRRLSNSERTTRLLDELQRNSEAIEKELLTNPEQILNGLRRASLYENLPEDPFEVYLRRKKPSLRESLSVFLGFQHDQGVKVDSAEEKPPPLPVNPPPVNPPEAPKLSLPLVTVTAEDDLPKTTST